MRFSNRQNNQARSYKWKDDHLGTLLLGLEVGGLCLLPLVVLVGTFTELDPFYFISEELLPHPFIRSIPVIIGVWLIRFMLGFLCVADFIRFGIFLITTAILTVHVIISVAMRLKRIDRYSCPFLYTQLRLLVAAIIWEVNVIAAGLIFVAQFASVFILWLVIKARNYLPTAVNVAFEFFSFYLIIFAALLIPTTAKIGTRTSQLVRSRNIMHYTTNYRETRSYYYCILWKSQQAIYIRCGHFFVFRRGVTMLYFREMVTNLVNAVLLIDPSMLT